jgi:hypothetical protein
MKTKFFSAIVASLCFALFASVVLAAKPKLTGIYSDMAYNAEGGDVLGDEAFIVFSAKGYYVVFQGGEGEPYPPVVVPAQVDGTSIRFTLPELVDARGEFRGRVVGDELVGSFKSNGQTLHLKRKNSYWQ